MTNHKGWQRVLGIIIPYLFIVGIFQMLGYTILKIDFTNLKAIHTIKVEKKLVIYFFTFIGSFITIYSFTKYVDKDSFVNLGFRLKNKSKDIFYGLFIGFVIFFLGFILLLSLKEINHIEINFDLKKTVLYSILFLFVAFIEETLFRGYILKNLMLSLNKYLALVISSLLFALMHSANPNMSFYSFLDLFLGGILLGVSYVFTKNLWFPIALHFSWNLFQSFFGFNVSGQNMYSIISFKITEDNLLNGGKFGFEGSILSIVFQILFIVLIFKFYKKQEPHL